jgi:hypothetical protein
MEQEMQVLFNLVIAIAGFLGIFVFNQIAQRLTKQEEKLHELPHTFVRRDDYRADMAEVKSMLHQIYEKLDGKADKHHGGGS